ncbi:MAG TPA: aminotransferase class I/II-fold pyridoxal phosphate-dependent enzyme [Acidimicrobiales bacterium]|nr:aminotransferase class I/II-fold pyridoxal phosphate-dependent enzyme [Acidimicrobiales bacterium]
MHGGRPPARPGAPVNPPVVLSSTFHQGGDPGYGRDGNPTWSALEEVLGALEGGRALAFASGLAAISAVIETLPIPGRVVVPGDAYNGTRRFLADVASRGRLRFRTVDVSDTGATLRVCQEMCETPGRPSGSAAGFGAGGLLWLESPTNPLLAVADIAALCEGAHALGMDVVVDNTFASPLLQRPLDLGADAVVHSATKILSGHSDVVMGAVVTGREDVAGAVARRRSLHGAIPGPWEAWLVLRGVRTLALRAERAGANAAELAARLAGHPAVETVRYPGLAGHPGHDLAARQMRGFGAMVAFDVRGGAEAAEAAVARLGLLTVATSLGGVETLIERRGRWEGEDGLPPGLLRMSVGIEDVEDLWADLDQALSAG